MDFLEGTALPQSEEHLALLIFVSAFTLLLLLPFIGFMISSLGYSITFLEKSKKSGKSEESRFAYNILKLITSHKGLYFALFAVPMISLTFAYAQILQDSRVDLSGYMAIIFVLFLLAIYFTFSFKNNLELTRIITSSETDSKDMKSEAREAYLAQKKKLEKSFINSGIYALILFLAGSYLLIGSIQFASHPENWLDSNYFITILLSVESFVYFFVFLMISLGSFSAFLLYLVKNQAEEYSDNYLSLVKGVLLRNGLIITVILPLFVLFSIFTNSEAQFNYGFFGSLAGVFLLIILISGLYYVMVKENHTNYAGILTGLFILLFAFWIAHDQYAFAAGTKEHRILLASNYREYREQLKVDLGAVMEEVSGEEVYNRICISCHQFEQKVVGPSYNAVLPKYENNMEELVNFILNPYKVDPQFPPMPDQGLKPNEAQAVAEYLMSTYKQQQ